MIILLNGSINSGKSSLAKVLAKKIPKAVILEIDTLRRLIKDVSLEEAIPINLENAVSLTGNFTRHGFNVIIPYPISEGNYKYFIKEFENTDQKIVAFTLDPSLEVAQLNRGGRKLSKWEQERVNYHYQIGIHKPSFGKIIDTTNLTINQTLKEVLNGL